MDEVAEGLFVGTLADAGDATELRKRDIAEIVSLTHEAPPDGFPAAATVRRVPMTDGPQNEQSAFETAAEAVRSRLDAGVPVLVHCRSGASRSPAVAATALALERRVDLENAFQQVAERRDAVDPHPALVRRAASVYSREWS